MESLSRFMDAFSEFFSQRKGLLPLIGIGLVLVNFLLRVFAAGWLVETDLFLHLGIILAIFGMLMARAL